MQITETHAHATAGTYEHYDPKRSRAWLKIPKSSPNHFVGEFAYRDRTGQPQRLGFGSLLEYKFAMIGIYRPDFFDIEEQLPPIRVLVNGRPKAHHLDFRLTTKACDGERPCRYGIAVKPECRASDPKFLAEMKAVRRVGVGTIFDRLMIVTERNIDPILLKNCELFHSARHPEPEIDAILAEALRAVDGPVIIDTFLDRIGQRGTGFRATARLLHRGYLTADPRTVITPKSVVWKAEAS